MSWLSCSLDPPPISETVMVRSGGSIFFAAYSRMRGWFAVLPGSKEEKIAEPEMWWQNNLSGGVEARHALDAEDPSTPVTGRVACITESRSVPIPVSGSSVPPAQNNLGYEACLFAGESALNHIQRRSGDDTDRLSDRNTSEQASPQRSRRPQQAFLGLLAQDSGSQSRSALVQCEEAP